ncbi:HAD family phosphatase, partial [filamentous cyanobacterium CCP5]
MSLKAVLLDFNGTVINDEDLHQQLIEQLLVEENLRPDPREINQVCLGRSDRACIAELLQLRGRVISDGYLDQLIARKAQNYQTRMASFDALPFYGGLDDLIYKIRSAQLKLAIVSGACRSDIDWVLARTRFQDLVSVIVSADDLSREASKPEPDGFLLAIERLKQQFPALKLAPEDCLAIEDSFAGIEA